MSEHFAVSMMRLTGLEPDPWQMQVLGSKHPQLLLNCCRQSGKSTVVAALALAEAAMREGTQVLLVSRSLRQSTELFRIVKRFHSRFGQYKKERRTAHELSLEGGSRIVCLPCKEETIRGFSGIDLLLLDEAARVPDDLYRAVLPMLATSGGRLICLSTPYGKRGFFWEAWANGGDDFERIEVPATMCPRIPLELLERQRRVMGESWFRQEYFCAFEALEGVVFPNFADCVVPGPAPAEGRLVGGIDFGFRNPFAAVWGILDRYNVLWLNHEYYQRERPISLHLPHLPRDVRWFADPSGANERSEMRVAGYAVMPGKNDIRAGLSLVTARLEGGMLRIIDGTCPNLLSEAGLYRYGDAVHGRAETPIDEHNHALSALRYLVSRLDERGLRISERLREAEPPALPPPERSMWVPFNPMEHQRIYGPGPGGD